MHRQQAQSSAQGYEALTEKEKQTLRLLLEGHDAKSMARHLALSIHTVNERLRDARRKLSVSSSKEAARLLRQFEGPVPKMVGDSTFGDAGPAAAGQFTEQPSGEPRPNRRGVWVVGGFAMISFLVAMLAVSAPDQTAAPDLQSSAPLAQSPAASAIADAALRWLALVDDAKWAESWAATGQSFRSVNSVAAWQSASEKARVPLGRVLSRKLVSEQDVPAPPNGYRMVRFQTDFANRSNAIETLSLDREGGSWKVVGIYIE